MGRTGARATASSRGLGGACSLDSGVRRHARPARPRRLLPTDLGVRHALEQLGEDGGPAAERLAERWRPYRAYAVQHLWARLGTGRAVAREDGAERAPDRLAA